MHIVRLLVFPQPFIPYALPDLGRLDQRSRLAYFWVARIRGSLISDGIISSSLRHTVGIVLLCSNRRSVGQGNMSESKQEVTA